uniref:Cadherin domain-containing protein n=1 Tax=Knipowitschia caucasica TaxID=637954 RepID=A0AAV2KD48_KNICA
MLLALFLVLAQTCKAADTSNSSSTVFQYSIWEEQPMGTQVASLSDDLHKRDELGHLEGFQIVEHGKTLPFSVNAPDGVISTQGRLDREQLCRNSDVCELAFSVLYRKGGDVNCLRVHVEIMDLNDNSPSFPSPFQELEISEMAALRMRIPLEHAVDPDAGPNGLQTYSLSANTHFALDVTAAPGGTKQAELVVIKELDREVKDAFELTLVAWDKGNPPRSGSTMVRVKIQDSNDNSPIFEDSKPVLELPEDTEIGHVIANLKASDPDEGDNGLVEYSISKHTRPETKRLFAIDSQTGDVSLKALLDYEDTRSHEVIVQARDKGPNSIPSHCKLHVKVLDVNDNAPRIHATWTTPNSPGPNVLEGAEIGTFLALVLVSDADSGEDAVALVTTFCRPVKRENRAYNCRHAESTYTRHPRRPQKNIRKSDIQLIPVIRGRKDDPLHDNSESQPLSTSSTMSEELPNERQYTLVPSCLNSSFHSQSYQEIDGIQASIHHGKTLCKPGNIELDSPLVITPASSYRTLRKSRNQSSSSSVSHASTLRRQRSEESNVSQATLRRQKTEGREAEQQRIWRNLVRLSMAAFGDSIELSAASPDVQQISQLLSLLRQGQLQPRTNFRGNKFSQRRYGTQDCGGDWQSTKDSGHGESEPGDGDMGWDGAAECPLEAQLEEGLSKLIHNNDEVFSDVPDPAWMARLSVPLSTDYHDNVFVPNGPPSTDSELLPPDRLDSSSSFSTFGKSVDRDEEPLNGALLSEVSSLFQMLMTQKGGSRLGPPPDVLYRLSNAYRQSKQQRAELHQ